MKFRLIGALVALLALSVPLTGIASAKAPKEPKSSAKADIQRDNATCGENKPEDPVMGKVTFKRVGDTLTVKVTLKKAEPNTLYEIDIYGNECSGIAIPATVETNSKGAGKATGSTTVPSADNEFFVAAWNTSELIASDTPYVTLP